MQVLSIGYLAHIDILVQIIIEKLHEVRRAPRAAPSNTPIVPRNSMLHPFLHLQVNQLQLYLLAINGVACGLAAAVAAWVIYSRLLAFRLAVYRTFLVVPPTWLRTLAVSQAARLQSVGRARAGWEHC